MNPRHGEISQTLDSKQFSSSDLVKNRKEPNLPDTHTHWSNTTFPICAVDRAGTALSGCRPRNTAFDRAVQMSTQGLRFMDALLESMLKVLFNIFLSDFVVRHFLSLEQPW